jgi:hypothetical protein
MKKRYFLLLGTFSVRITRDIKRGVTALTTDEGFTSVVLTEQVSPETIVLCVTTDNQPSNEAYLEQHIDNQAAFKMKKTLQNLEPTKCTSRSQKEGLTNVVKSSCSPV